MICDTCLCHAYVHMYMYVCMHHTHVRNAHTYVMHVYVCANVIHRNVRKTQHHVCVYVCMYACMQRMYMRACICHTYAHKIPCNVCVYVTRVYVHGYVMHIGALDTL